MISSTNTASVLKLFLTVSSLIASNLNNFYISDFKDKIKMLYAPTVLVKRSNQHKSTDSLTKSILHLLKEVSMVKTNQNLRNYLINLLFI